MAGRRDGEAFDLEDISDATLRKNIFREHGKDVSSGIRSGYQTDAPGAIARLMEKAFRAGLALGADPDFKPTNKDETRVVTDMDVPSLPREQLYRIRMAIGLNPFGEFGQRSHACKPESLVMFMRPRDPRLPSTMSKDTWYHVGGIGGDGLSSKVVNPYIKLGLYDEPYRLEDGWRVAVMTEWGYELMVRGKAAGMKGRHPGSSSTYGEYSRLMGEDPWVVVQSAGRMLGFVK